MIFVDTSFWVGLQLRRDPNHDIAKALWEASRDRLVSSNLVIGETWTFLRRRAGHAQAVAFIDHAGRSQRLTVKRVAQDSEAEAWRWLRQHDEREYSFVDATSFALMNRLRLREAFAFDGDFAAAGFIEVRPPDGKN